MNSRERVRRALTFQHPDRAPRELWVLMATDMLRMDEVNAVLERFPPDITYPTAEGGWNFRQVRHHGPHVFRYGRSERARGTPYQAGGYVDAWGTPWEVGEVGVTGEVKHPPLADWSALARYAPPREMLDGANWDDVNRFCDETEQFVIAAGVNNPFERMQWLRGTEQVFTDLAWGSAELLRLRDLVHDFFMREIELWCKTNVDAIKIQDDWGAQNALLIRPQMWRDVFKPLYADYCRLIRAAGKFVFMHSDGHISDIYPDLIEVGVDALNSQLFCMDIEELARKHRGQITFWGELDRQYVLPFGTPDDVRRAVRRVRRAMDSGEGGAIAQMQFGKYDPLANIVAAYEAWME